jgi:sec-independent protein translocase protein TatB
MFDIAFSELIVIALVTLIVIGPERLPRVARMIGALTGRMQRYVAQVKDEINREARFEELQQLQQEIQATGVATKAKLKSATGLRNSKSIDHLSSVESSDVIMQTNDNVSDKNG